MEKLIDKSEDIKFNMRILEKRFSDTLSEVINGYKMCLTCWKMKPITEFSKNNRNKSKIHTYCKQCDFIKHSKYLEKNKDKMKHCDVCNIDIKFLNRDHYRSKSHIEKLKVNN